ncbi:MAG TPA: hypothetical protein VF875_17515 [Anaeromyxobacter sp.]
MDHLTYLRLHADANGESHLARHGLALSSAEDAPHAPSMELSALAPAAGWRFLHLPARWVGDWHPTPKRIWIFCLGGEMEFRASDGESHRLQPGGSMLLEDTVGRGHHSRVLGDRDALLVAVQLDAEQDPEYFDD